MKKITMLAGRVMLPAASMLLLTACAGLNSSSIERDDQLAAQAQLDGRFAEARVHQQRADQVREQDRRSSGADKALDLGFNVLFDWLLSSEPAAPAKNRTR